MIDFPIAELMDHDVCTLWLGWYLHPQGFVYPHCGHAERRVFAPKSTFRAYHGRACEGYYTRLTGMVFANTRQPPATFLLVLRGIGKGEPTTRLAHMRGLLRKQLHIRRHRLQAHVNETAPTGVMIGTAFAADTWYHNAGEQQHAASRPHGSPLSGVGFLRVVMRPTFYPHVNPCRSHCLRSQAA
jgi:hypothetical protein